MDDKMLLDGLFILIALLLLPIGFRRGLTREVFVTAGLLVGAKLADSWARPWGSDLEDLIDVRAGSGQLAISIAFIVGGALVFGYAGAAAARIDRPGTWARFGGALLAVINGALIAAFILRDIERFLADEGTQRSLEQSRVARTLLHDFGWVLIGMAAFVLLAIAVSLIVGDRQAVRPVAVATTPTWQMPAPVAKRKRRLGWGRDDGKVEPQARGYNPAVGRYEADTPHYSDTMPIAPVRPSNWSVDRSQGPTNGNEWLEVAQGRGQDTDPGVFPPAEGATNRCFSCGERLTADDAFCPRCGRARGL
jgi:uncharacterized membrane protein required for colicin V production